MILLDALYVNNGGGKVLLDYLIKKIVEKKLDFYFLLDNRIKEKYVFRTKNFIYLKPTFFNRHLFYFKNKNKFSSVFAFGNIPPTIRLSCKVYTYLQNVHYVDNSLHSLSFFLNKFIFNVLVKNSDYFLVQSVLVKNQLSKKINKNKIFVYPFFGSRHSCEKRKINKNKINFIYVSSGEKYKNHVNLLKAFQKYNLKFPSSILTLTVSKKYKNLFKIITNLKNNNINIKNLENISHNKIFNEYKKADVMIFPSNNESFGLGLIEAAQMNMPIITSNKDYVFQIVKPSATFNAENHLSIYETMYNHDLYIKNSAQSVVLNRIDEMLDFISNKT